MEVVMLKFTNSTSSPESTYTQQELLETIILPIFQNYPELSWFADEQVASTSEGKINENSLTNNWTVLLQNKELINTNARKYIELERTLHSLVCFHLILDGSIKAYNYWIQKQKNPILTKESFDKLHNLTNQYAATSNDKQAIEASLVYSDLGKTNTMKNKAHTQNILQHDHDDLIAALCKSPENVQENIINSFAKIDKPVKEHFLDLHLFVPLQWGNIIQLEGGAKMFDQFLSILLTNPEKNLKLLLNQNFLINVSDVAGAMAHIIPEGSATFNQNTFYGFQAVLNSIEEFLEDKNPQHIILKLIKIKQQQLGYDNQLNQEKLFILARIGTFLRFYTKEEGELLLNNAISLWNQEDWKLLEEIFSLNSGINSWQRNPTYMPAVLLNLFNSNQEVPRNYQAALNGVIILAKISQEYQTLGNSNNEHPLSFNNLAAQARDNPDLFKQIDSFKINWDQDFKTVTIDLLTPTIKTGYKLTI